MSTRSKDPSRKRQKLIESLFDHSHYMEHDENTIEHKAMSKALDSVESWETYTDCIVLSPFVFYRDMICFRSHSSEDFRFGILLDDVHKRVDGNKKICMAFEGGNTSAEIQVDPDVSDRLIVEFLESFFAYYHEQLHELQKAQTKQARKRMSRVKEMMPSLGQCPGCGHSFEVDNSHDFVTCDHCHSDLVNIDGSGLEMLTPMNFTETDVVLDSGDSAEHVEANEQTKVSIS